MELIEIRELDGPNLFLLQPAIKLELRPAEHDLTREALAALLGRLGRFGNSDEGQRAGLAAFGDLLVDAALALQDVGHRTGAGARDLFRVDDGGVGDHLRRALRHAVGGDDDGIGGGLGERRRGKDACERARGRQPC